MEDLKYSLSSFQKISYFLEYVFKKEIDTHLKEFQNNFLDISKESINEKRELLISIISKLKLELKNEKTDFNFTQTNTLLNNRIRKEKKITIDCYYRLTGAFNTSYSFELLKSFEIILESLKEYDLIQSLAVKNETNELKHPFSKTNNLDLFKYFDEWFKPQGEKVKYTYIFNFFIEQKKETFSESKFFKYASIYTGLKLGVRKHSDNSVDYTKRLIELENDYNEAK
jgi:hypothetical protein